jgi:O-antigen/teichoic acid export membrane protein
VERGSGPRTLVPPSETGRHRQQPGRHRQYRTADADAPAPGSLSGRVRHGLRWSFIGLAASKLGTLISGIVLARLLAPSDYGVFAVALVALLLVANLNDLGLEQSLVRWSGDITGVAPTAKTVILLSSIVQFGLLYSVAPYFSAALGAPQATGVVRLLAFGVVVNGAFAVPSALLTRAFRQDLRAAADFAGFAVSTVLTIVLAVMGLGPWSLAIGRVVGNLVNGLLHRFFARPRYGFGFNTAIAGPLMRQGLPIAGLSLLAVAALNVDNVIVGRYLGPTELGIYTLAFNISSWPVGVFSVAVWRVSVPAFAQLQEDRPRLRAAFARSFGLLMTATLPVCALLAALAQPLVSTVYGDKWAAAAAVLSVLAALGALRVGLQLMTDVLVAVGRSHVAFALQVVWLLLLIPALAFGSTKGLVGVGVAHVLVALAVVLPLHLLALHVYGLKPAAALRQAARPLLFAVLAGGAAYACTLGTTGRVFALVTLAVGGCAGALVYAAGIAPKYRHLLLARRGRSGRLPAVPAAG